MSGEGGEGRGGKGCETVSLQLLAGVDGITLQQIY